MARGNGVVAHAQSLSAVPPASSETPGDEAGACWDITTWGISVSVTRRELTTVTLTENICHH